MYDLILTKEFEEATKAIKRDIIQNPQKYKHAGNWLDQYFDDDSSWQKMLKSSERIVSHYFPFPDSRKQGCRFLLPDEYDNCLRTMKELVQAVAVVEFGKFLRLTRIYLTTDEMHALERDFTKEQFVELYSKTYDCLCEECQKVIPSEYKLWLPCKKMLKVKEKCKFLGQEDSRIVCLLTWLLVDPDANKAALSITKFDKWEWYASYESEIYSRRSEVIQLLHKCGMLQDWQNLTCEVWQNLENEKIAKAKLEYDGKSIEGLIKESTNRRQKSKYTPGKIKNMQTSFNKHLNENKGVKYAWECVAEEHGLRHGKAAEMAVRRHSKKNK
ncbi:MAG: hypothetical protein ACFFCW_01065 [Candidatus Hodarchaeota archaeon]